MRDEFVTFSVTVSEYNMNERSLFERRALFPFSLGGGIAGEAMDLRVLEHSGEAYPQENELVDRSIVQLEASGAADKMLVSNAMWIMTWCNSPTLLLSQSIRSA